MLEAMIGGPIGKKLYFDLNFEREAVGSNILIDHGSLGMTLTRVANGGSVGDSVVNDPVFGKCYKFDGNAYFVGSKALGIYNKQYRMRIKFVPNTSGSRSLVEAGNYPSSGNIKAGWNLSINQFTQTYFQMFMTQVNGAYARLLPTGVNPGNTVMEDFEITRIGSTITVTNMRTGASASNTFNPGGENTLYIAGGYTGNWAGAFIGLLKSFTVELLS